MSVSVLTLAIDYEEIRKANRNRRCYGAWTVFAFQGMRNEPGKDLARERQVIITTKIKQLRGSLMN